MSYLNYHHFHQIMECARWLLLKNRTESAGNSCGSADCASRYSATSWNISILLGRVFLHTNLLDNRNSVFWNSRMFGSAPWISVIWSACLDSNDITLAPEVSGELWNSTAYSAVPRTSSEDVSDSDQPDPVGTYPCQNFNSSDNLADEEAQSSAFFAGHPKISKLLSVEWAQV